MIPMTCGLPHPYENAERQPAVCGSASTNGWLKTGRVGDGDIAPSFAQRERRRPWMLPTTNLSAEHAI